MVPSPVRFRSSFLIGLASAMAATTLLFFPKSRSAEAQPPFPLPGKSYVSHYSEGLAAHSADYYLLLSGAFGFRERMAEADILLLGTSHVVFGFSSDELSRRLSLALGRPVRTFNASIFASNETTNNAIAVSNGLRGKTLVNDLFSSRDGFNVSDAPPRVSKAKAVWSIAKIWAPFYRDYLTGLALPRIAFRPDGSLTRPDLVVRPVFATTEILIREWNHNDALWNRDEERITFPEPAWGASPYAAGAPSYYSRFDNQGILRRVDRAGADRRGDRSFYTVIPYADFERAVLPADAVPLLPIAAEGLYFFDTVHCTAQGRSLATERLADTLAPLLR